MYPKELYRNNHYRVVHGAEEEAQFKAQGWKEEKTPGQEYVVHHSGIPEGSEMPTPVKRGPGRPSLAERTE